MHIILSILFFVIAFVAQAKTFDTTLNNGLKIIVKEDNRAPVAVSMIWYNVGSSDEVGGTTGISHALEHMMFKGTPKYPTGEFSRIIASSGGTENAFTSNDFTAYYIKIATQNLEKAIELEADRMQNLILKEEDFASEIKVIQEERRFRTDDNPKALTFERFMATAHLASPYHHPVIGWMNDIQNMNYQDLQNWYELYYAPNNATLVIVGDVDANNVFRIAEKYFGNIQKSQLPVSKPKLEPPFLGKKYVEIIKPAKIPLLALGYAVPSLNTIEDETLPYALELIAGVLDAGDNGRLTKELIVKQQLAMAIQTSYNLYSKYSTQFVFFALPAMNKPVEDLQKGLLKEIDKLKATLISKKELQRIKTQIIAQKTFEKDSLINQAMEPGMLESIGLGWQTAEEYVKNIQKVTPLQIQNVAKSYFTDKRLTEARLIPADLK